MTKHAEYKVPYIVSHNISQETAQAQTTQSSGVTRMLHVGRMVSLQTNISATGSDLQVSTYAEGVGLVTVNHPWLNRMR